MKWFDRLKLALLVVVAALTGLTAWANEAVRQTGTASRAALEAMVRVLADVAGVAADAPGIDPSVPVFASNLLVAPAAVLVFALAFDWAVRRHWVRAALGLIPLPLWSTCLLLRDSWPADAVYLMVVGLQFQGVAPFGVR